MGGPAERSSGLNLNPTSPVDRPEKANQEGTDWSGRVLGVKVHCLADEIETLPGTRSTASRLGGGPRKKRHSVKHQIGYGLELSHACRGR